MKILADNDCQNMDEFKALKYEDMAFEAGAGGPS